MAGGRDVTAGRAYILIEAKDRSRAALQKINQSLRTLRKYVPTLKRISNVLRTISRRVRRVGEGFRRMGHSMMRVGGVLTGAFMGLLFPIFQGIRAAKTFRNEMNALNAVLEATAEQSADLEDLVRQLGRSTSFTATEVASAAQVLARGNFSLQEVKDSLSSVLALARSGKVDLPTAANTMVKAIRAFGMEASDASKVADQLFQASREGTATVQELAISLSFSAGTANRMNMSLAETVGILGKMANRMLQGSKGGTSLNRMLTGLATEAPKVARNLGVSVYDAGGQPRSMIKVLEDMSVALKALPLEKQMRIVKNLFNIRGARAALAATQSFHEISGAIDRIENSSGAAAKAQEEMNKGIVGSVNKIMSALNELAISFGDAFAGILKTAEDKFIPVINDLSDWINRNENIGKIIVGVVAAVGSLGAVLIGVGSAISLLGATIASAAIIGKFALIAGVVGGAYTAFLKFTKIGQRVAEKIKTVFKDVFKPFQETFTVVIDLLKSGQLEAASDVMMMGMELSWKMGTENLYQVWLEFNQKVVAVITNMSKTVLDIAETMWKGLADTWAGIWTGLRPETQGMRDQAMEVARRKLEAGEINQGEFIMMKQMIEEGGMARSIMSNREANRVKADINNLFDSWTESAEEFGATVEDSLDFDIGKSEERLESLREKLDNLLAGGRLKAKFPDFFSRTMEALTGVSGSFEKLKKKMPEGFMGQLGEGLMKTFTRPKRPDWMKKGLDMFGAGIMTPKMEMAAGVFNWVRDKAGVAADSVKKMMDETRRGAGPVGPPQPALPSGGPVPDAFMVGGLASENLQTWRKVQQIQRKQGPEAQTAKNTAEIRRILDERLPRDGEEGEADVEGV